MKVLASLNNLVQVLLKSDGILRKLCWFEYSLISVKRGGHLGYSLDFMPSLRPTQICIIKNNETLINIFLLIFVTLFSLSIINFGHISP